MDRLDRAFNRINWGCEKIERGFNVVENNPLLGLVVTPFRIWVGAAQATAGLLTMAGGKLIGLGAEIAGSPKWENRAVRLYSFGGDHVRHGVANMIAAIVNDVAQATLIISFLFDGKDEFAPPLLPYTFVQNDVEQPEPGPSLEPELEEPELILELEPACDPLL